MTLEVVTFWGLAVLLIGSALAVVLTKNLFHSVLYLALSLTATAGVFLALGLILLAGAWAYAKLTKKLEPEPASA